MSSVIDVNYGNVSNLYSKNTEVQKFVSGTAAALKSASSVSSALLKSLDGTSGQSASTIDTLLLSNVSNVVSAKMRQVSNNFTTYLANAQQGAAISQTAGGALENISGVFEKMKTLATELAASGTQTSSRTAKIDEFNKLKESVNATISNTEFNGQKLFTGNYTANLQLGPRTDQTATVKFANPLGGMNVNSLNVANQEAAAGALKEINAALENVKSGITALTESKTKFNAIVESYQTYTTSLNNTVSGARIANARDASQAAKQTQTLMLLQASASTSAQASGVNFGSLYNLLA